MNKRIVSIALSVIMAFSGMTAYAGEYSDADLQPQTVEAAEKAGTDLKTEASLLMQESEETELETEQFSETEMDDSTDDFENSADERNTQQDEDDNAIENNSFETAVLENNDDFQKETQESSVEEERFTEEKLETQESFTDGEELETQESFAGEENLNAEESFESVESLTEEESLESEESITEEESLESVESFNAENSLESMERLESDESPTEEVGLVIEFADTSSYEYTGTAIRPEIKVRNNGKDLTEGSDYAVRYTNNINVSTGAAANKQPKVTVTGKGAFSGSTSATFRIARKDINAEDVIKSRMIVVRGKKASMPAIYYGSTKLTAKDFSYNKATVFNTVGSTTLAVTGAGNFSGNTVIDVTVVENAAAQKESAKKFGVTIDKTKASQLIYTGESLEEALRSCIQVNAKDTANTNLTANAAQNYRIVFPQNVTNAGTVKFTVVGIGDYSGCNIAKTCKILPKTIQSSDILLNENAAQAAIKK